jgi:hypothetical protein
MPPNAYYLAGSEVLLDEEAEQSRLIHRLRQYLEVRNLSFLIGNGCSIPLGAPLIHDVRQLLPELDVVPYRLDDEAKHKRARDLLDRLLPKTGALGVEPLLTVLTNIQANAQILDKPQSIDGAVVGQGDSHLLERLLKKWLFIRCKALSLTQDTMLQAHEELLRRILLRSTTLPRVRIFTAN